MKRRRWYFVAGGALAVVGLAVSLLNYAGVLAQIPWIQGARGMTRGKTVLVQRAPALPSNLSRRQLAADNDPNNWLLYGRNYQAWRYSPLTQITRQNVGRLSLAWQLDTGTHEAFEASPIVVNGVMYVSTPWNHVLALDAVTGKLYWRYAYEQSAHPILCCDAVNRGVAVGSGKV
ncbi:MAG: PQQ-binding-like beta-propeller repeat protein, partial [Planctomycetes bacterium]|nr:PQQ-binding-like beta-propeller repeat protein [Planctomycetota bacterium]